jgi:hypothetical protein
MGLHLRPGDTESLAFYNAYFGQLVGATITSFAMVPDEPDDEFPDYEGEIWPTFGIKLANGLEGKMELSSDEEGNSAGFLFGLPTPPREP